MTEQSITCGSCGRTQALEIPDGATHVPCPACGATCEIPPAEARPRLKLKLRTGDDLSAPTPETEATDAIQASPAPEPGADPPRTVEPPPLPVPPLATVRRTDNLPPPPPRDIRDEEESVSARWLKFIGGIILWTIVLTGLHVLGRMDNDGAYYFKFLSSWTTRALYIGLLYLTIQESFTHFLLLLFLPLMMLFGFFDVASLGAHFTAKTMFNMTATGVIALGYPIYLIYVVVRVIESRVFKMYFFAMILASMASGIYDIAIKPKTEDEETATRTHALQEKLRDAMDSTSHSSRPDE